MINDYHKAGKYGRIINSKAPNIGNFVNIYGG